MASRPGQLAQLRAVADRRFAQFMVWARRYRALWPAAAIVAVTVVAYNLTLTSMFDYLRLETPLAYLPLLPFFSVGIALFTAHRYPVGAAVSADRHRPRAHDAAGA